MAPKTWYIVPPSQLDEFEAFIASNVSNFDYVNQYGGGAPNVFAMKKKLYNPTILLEKAQGIKVSRIVWEAESFVAFGSRTYHVGFDTRYNIAGAKNFAYHSWFGLTINIAKQMRQVRAFPQRLLLIELFELKVTNFIINAFKEFKNTGAWRTFLADQAGVVKKPRHYCMKSRQADPYPQIKRQNGNTFK